MKSEKRYLILLLVLFIGLFLAPIVSADLVINPEGYFTSERPPTMPNVSEPWYSDVNRSMYVHVNCSVGNFTWTDGEAPDNRVHFYRYTHNSRQGTYYTGGIASISGIAPNGNNLQTVIKASYPVDTNNYWYECSWLPPSDLPSSFYFTAIPSAGNQSLNVTFSPYVSNLSDLAQIFYNFDNGKSGLIPELKFDAVPFTYVYSAPGHFTASVKAYFFNSPSIEASQNIDVYNYSLGITPTPTITVNPTLPLTPIPPNQSGYLKVSVFDYINGTLIPSVNIGIYDTNDVAAGWYNVTATSGIYTFRGYGSGANKNFVDGHSYYIAMSKTGYESRLGQITYTPPNQDVGYYLMPLTSIPESYDFTLGIKFYDAYTRAEISEGLLGSVKLSNQTSSWSETQNNPENGLMMFNGLTPSDAYKINAELQGYESYTGYFSSSSSMVGTTQWFYAYLTPSSQLPNDYTLIITPSSGTFNDTYNARIEGDLSTAQEIVFNVGSENMPDTPFIISDYSGQAHYKKISGTWKIWDGNAWSISTSLPQNINVVFPSNHGNDALYTAYVTIITTSNKAYTAMDTITILNNGLQPVLLRAFDISDYHNPWITNFNSFVHDIYEDKWYNNTWTSENIENAYLYFTPFTILQYYGTAAGYQNSPLQTFTVTNNEHYDEIDFYFQPLSSLPITNVTLYVHVVDTVGNGLSGATIRLSDNQTSTSLSNGYNSFIVLNNTYYSAIASGLSGYTSGTGSTTTTAGNNEIKITLLRITPTTPIYTTAEPTGYVTTLPTYNPEPTLNQTLGASCDVLPVNASYIDVLKNQLACNGIKTKVGQEAILGLIIILVCAYFLGRVGKGIGVIGGVIAGAAVSFYLQLFPFWLVIFVCVCAGIVFAAKIFGSNEK